MQFMFKGNLVEYDYLFSNHAKAILFLHGWGGNKNSFITCINFFKTRYNILSISMPPNKNSPLALTMDDYKQLILDLLKLHNINSVIIICHSFGCRVTLTLLSSKINIEKIIITGGAGIILKPKFLIKLNQNHNRILLKKHPQLFNKFASMDYKNLTEINRITFKNIINKNLTNYIQLLTSPALLFWGKNDTATPIKFIKVFKRFKPNTKSIVVKGSHFAYLEYPQLFISECNNFLKS